MLIKMIREKDGAEAVCEEYQVADLEAIGFVDAEAKAKAEAEADKNQGQKKTE